MNISYNGKQLQVEDAYAANDGNGNVVYIAHATDEDGTEYQITWQTVDGWTDHVAGDDGQCVVPDCSGWCDDEGEACDWDAYQVREL